MKTYKYLVLLLLVFHLAGAQNRLELKHLGFSIQEPEGWIKGGRQELLKNLERFPVKDTLHSVMSKNINSNKQRISYYKYDPLKTNGIIPTVNIVVSSTKRKSFEDFRRTIEKSQEQAKGLLKNFTATKPSVRVINGNKVWEVKAEYDFSDTTGKGVRLKNHELYIYRGSSYISISFIDEVGKEDNSALYNKLAETITLTNINAKK